MEASYFLSALQSLLLSTQPAGYRPNKKSAELLVWIKLWGKAPDRLNCSRCATLTVATGFLWCRASEEEFCLKNQVPDIISQLSPGSVCSNMSSRFNSWQLFLFVCAVHNATFGNVKYLSLSSTAGALVILLCVAQLCSLLKYCSTLKTFTVDDERSVMQGAYYCNRQIIICITDLSPS